MKFEADIFSIFDEEWALLTAGTPERFNSMTVSWGGLGTLWGKPVATVYVRDSRYTLEFMENSDYFTVSFYPEECRKALGIFGSKSGRDTDKAAETGFIPAAVEAGEAAGKAVTYGQAKKTLVCRKLYKQRMDLMAMPEDVRAEMYADGDDHNLFIGEVVEIL